MAININWVKTQFEAAKVKINTGNAVLDLLKYWETMKLTEPQKKDVIAVFSKVALGISLVETNKDEIWIPAQPGQISIGDLVRVKNDGYSGDLASIHNGRPGTVVAIRSGDIIVDITDLLDPVLKGVHYRPNVLEKRIR
jgi:hypothetical protein